MYGCFQANILAVNAVQPRCFNFSIYLGTLAVGLGSSLSDMDLSTHALTADQYLLAFGVCQELVGGETPASNQ